MTSYLTLDDLGDVAGKRALVRVDLNVPMKEGGVSDDTRLRATVPTVTELARRGAIVLMLAHLGRPDGERQPEMSLSLIVPAYRKILDLPLRFINDCAGELAKRAVVAMGPGEVALLENTRFHEGEEKNDPAFAAAMAQLGDFYVNDAFSAAHRAHSSTEGIAHLLPAYAGRAMAAELSALEKVLGNPERPLAAVVGGAKVSTKLEVLRNLVARVDHLFLAGGMANTFLAARGQNVGKSLVEHDLADAALSTLDAAERTSCAVHLPCDVVVAKELASDPPSIRTISVGEVGTDEMILDLGPATIRELADTLKTCRTMVWNGPLGAFEITPFDQATLSFARSAAGLTREGHLTSVAGGGDTDAALDRAGVAADFTFVSTAGGAFLEWMAGRELPGVKALEASKDARARSSADLAPV